MSSTEKGKEFFFRLGDIKKVQHKGMTPKVAKLVPFNNAVTTNVSPEAASSLFVPDHEDMVMLGAAIAKGFIAPHRLQPQPGELPYIMSPHMAITVAMVNGILVLYKENRTFELYGEMLQELFLATGLQTTNTSVRLLPNSGGFYDPLTKTIKIAMRFHLMGDVSRLLFAQERPGNATIKVITQKMCAAINNIHALDHVHRDLKSTNIAITASTDGQEFDYESMDYGSSRVLPPGYSSETLAGTASNAEWPTLRDFTAQQSAKLLRCARLRPRIVDDARRAELERLLADCGYTAEQLDGRSLSVLMLELMHYWIEMIEQRSDECLAKKWSHHGNLFPEDFMKSLAKGDPERARLLRLSMYLFDGDIDVYKNFFVKHPVTVQELQLHNAYMRRLVFLEAYGDFGVLCVRFPRLRDGFLELLRINTSSHVTRPSFSRLLYSRTLGAEHGVAKKDLLLIKNLVHNSLDERSAESQEFLMSHHHLSFMSFLDFYGKMDRHETLFELSDRHKDQHGAIYDEAFLKDILADADLIVELCSLEPVIEFSSVADLVQDARKTFALDISGTSEKAETSSSGEEVEESEDERPRKKFKNVTNTPKTATKKENGFKTPVAERPITTSAPSSKPVTRSSAKQVPPPPSQIHKGKRKHGDH